MLGGECEGCGITDQRVLTIDHRGGGGSQARRNGGPKQIQFYKLVVANPAPYRVLCHNCNWLARLGELTTTITETISI